MGNRDFSDTVKLATIKANLKANNGEIHCGVCNIKLSSIEECHFDHIIPYAKGGKSNISNCQILCVDCNLKKNDKALKDFVLEESAKRFWEGKSLDAFEGDTPQKEDVSTPSEMTKDLFDKLINDFIQKKGNIHKVDFGREYNKLPSIHYVKLYYGSLVEMKKSFGIEDFSYSWNRESIKKALAEYIAKTGTISQKDLIKSNKLPSLPCILNFYPECNSFSDIKRQLCNIDVAEVWTIENAIAAGKAFVEKQGRITQKDLHSTNHLPSNNVINSLFGSLANYQESVGTEISHRNEFISKNEIDKAVEIFFDGKERTIKSRKDFFEVFPFSPSTIEKRYGSFSAFCEEYNIQVLN